MAENTLPKKNVAHTFYVTLVATASRPDFQANPTLAAGDVEVSTDGGAYGNLATLPVVTPASGVAVKVDLSAAEMNGDNVTVKFIDAAGAEWDDLFIEIRPATRNAEDLAFTSDVLDKLGAVDEAAAAGDPSATESVMQYVKQIVNILAGGTGVVTMPAAAAPANNVSIAEMVRAIYDDTNALDGTKIPDTISLAAINAEVDTALATTTYAEPGQEAPGTTVSLEKKLSYLYKFMRNKIEQTSTTQSFFNDAGTVVDHKATVSDDATTFTREEVVTGP